MKKRLRLWNFKLELDQGSKLPLFMQIAQKIIEEIQLGRLPPSTAMPGTRQLAASLDLNRKTVVLAYEELIAQGWLCSAQRSRTYVSADLPQLNASSSLTPAHTRQARQQIQHIPPPAPVLQARSDLIDFNDGMPDTRLIPAEVISRAFRHTLLGKQKSNYLAYGDPKGVTGLRRSVATMLNMERGLYVDIDNICIVRGSQMGIFLAARILVRPGDHVVVEALTYPPAREAFRSCGANILTVGVDEHGLRVDALEALCQQHQIRAVYVTPHHQFPTTVMMTAERRLKLLMLAERYGFYLIEDDYDHEFHFTHHPILPLASNDNHGRVIYVGSLSKVLAPALRVGYVVASAAFIAQCGQQILLIDRQGNSVTEQVVSELIDSGEVKRHIRRTFKIYAERRDLLQTLIHQHLTDHIDFDLPLGGLAFWLRLKPGMDMQALLMQANTIGINLLQASEFSMDQANLPALRLGFGSLSASELETGILRLAQALETIGHSDGV